ncbi:MAG: hypothetical protein L0220_12245, partial [Acidobacteria bacterium]|nr:hypothetical protein [Acidobacteriota bacterium]
SLPNRMIRKPGKIAKPGIAATLSIFDLTIDFIGYGWRAARQPYPMKSIVKSKMDKVEFYCVLAINHLEH